MLSGRECLGEGRKGYRDWGWDCSVSEVVRQRMYRGGQKGVYGLGGGGVIVSVRLSGRTRGRGYDTDAAKILGILWCTRDYQ